MAALPRMFLRPMRRPAATVLLSTLTVMRSVSAQTDASVGVGLGTVRYPGGSSIGIVSFSPTLEHSTPERFLTLGSLISALPHGAWYAQGRGGLWIASPPLLAGWRLATDVALAGTTSGVGTGASGTGQLIGEVLRIGPRWGCGATGQSAVRHALVDG